jgi:hypothetical protein
VTAVGIYYRKIFSKKEASGFEAIISPRALIPLPFLRLFYRMRDGTIITAPRMMEPHHRQRFLLYRQAQLTIPDLKIPLTH